MSENNKVYLTALSYELGDFYSVEEVDELKENPKILDTLLKLGLKKYSKSQLTPLEIAKRSALRTLERANMRGEDIDALIYATNSFWNLAFYGIREVSCFIDELGLDNAYPIGVFFSECGNLQTAVRTAYSLIKSEDCKNVLLITTDKISETDSRIVPPNISVKSDAAASCVLSSNIKREFEVIYNYQCMNAKMKDIEPNEQPLEYFEKIMEGVKRTVDQVVTNIKKEPKDFRKLILNNYNLSVTKSICMSLGFDVEQAYTDNISRFAHAIAADNLINLYDFSSTNNILVDDLILLLGTGPNMWGTTILQKV